MQEKKNRQKFAEFRIKKKKNDWKNFKFPLDFIDINYFRRKHFSS